jgi:hypothetical protein
MHPAQKGTPDRVVAAAAGNQPAADFLHTWQTPGDDWRPKRVVASEHRTSNATTLVLTIPKDAPFRLRAAAHEIAHELTRRLDNKRWSTTYALGSATLSGPWMQQQLAAGGIHVTDRTAYSYVQDLVDANALQQVGQLPGRLRKRDGDWIWARGANVYSLSALAQKVIALGRDLFGRLQLPKRSSSLSYLPVSSVFTEKRRRNRAEGALAWAIQTAYPGCRDRIGWRLAVTVRKAGLDQDEAEDVVARYQECVGDRKYTRADARGTVRRAYRDPRVSADEDAYG